MDFFHADPIVDANSMKDWELRSQLTMDDVARFIVSLGAEVEIHQSEGFIICPTICHNPIDEEGSRKLYYYDSSKSFYCFTQCSETMDIYELYKRYMRINHYAIELEDAKIYVKRFFIKIYDFEQQPMQGGYKGLDLDVYKISNEIPTNSFYPKHLAKMWSKFYHPSWLAEGITPEAMDRFDIGFSYGRNQIIIPHYDIGGNLVGIRTRNFEPEDVARGKYMPLFFNGEIYRHHLGFNLYGIYEHQNAIRILKRAIIYESEKSVLKDHGHYGENSVAVATCGSVLNKFQVSILTTILGVNEITIAFDKEYDNFNSLEGIAYKQKLRKICEKYRHMANFSFIYDERNLLKRKDAPIDIDKETLEVLYRRRIKIDQ